MIFTLKPIGMVVTIILCIFSFVAIKNLKKSLTIFFFLLTPILIENLFFYKKFDERSTILKESIIGKLFSSGSPYFTGRHYGYFLIHPWEYNVGYAYRLFVCSPNFGPAEQTKELKFNFQLCRVIEDNHPLE